MELPQRIIEQASALFKRFGVRGVTMDDIAGKLGISKKTIYQYFANKATMLESVAKDYFEEEKAHFEEISKQSSDAVDEILRILHWSIKSFENLSPTLIIEVQKFYPKTWELIEKFQKEYLLGKIRQNLSWGVNEGLFRQEINIELVSQIRLIQILNLVNPMNFPAQNFNPKEIQTVSVDLYLHSVLSPKGLQLYQQRIIQPNTYNN
ncbi:MAG: TetR/AcrR family transcriptional regulator [Bacteroidia bacterium]|nr:TetR/AcrR family transcriptional regulator [Bacteroidia bacterium]